jgi:hypothetical protein
MNLASVGPKHIFVLFICFYDAVTHFLGGKKARNTHRPVYLPIVLGRKCEKYTKI